MIVAARVVREGRVGQRRDVAGAAGYGRAGGGRAVDVARAVGIAPLPRRRAAVAVDDAVDDAHSGRAGVNRGDEGAGIRPVLDDGAVHEARFVRQIDAVRIASAVVRHRAAHDQAVLHDSREAEVGISGVTGVGAARLHCAVRDEAARHQTGVRVDVATARPVRGPVRDHAVDDQRARTVLADVAAAGRITVGDDAVRDHAAVGVNQDVAASS